MVSVVAVMVAGVVMKAVLMAVIIAKPIILLRSFQICKIILTKCSLSWVTSLWSEWFIVALKVLLIGGILQAMLRRTLLHM